MRRAHGFAARRLRLATVCAPLLALSLAAGCAAGGFTLDKADVDPSIVTGKIETGALPTNDLARQDEATIRNAVSSADVATLNGGAVPWANSETGSRGLISSLREEKDAGSLCRSFTTSRESFDGVALYKGQVCMAAPGAWRMQGFNPL